MAQRKPAEVFPPGEFISEELEARGWSQVELAEVLGRSTRLVSELISAKRAITPETAKGLGAAFGTGPEFWMNLERDFRLAHALHDDRTVERRSALYAKTPIKEMVKRGWIEHSDNVEVLEGRALSFLGLSNLDEQPWLAHAAKRSETAAHANAAQWAWLFRVRQMAESVVVPPYSERALADSIERLEALLMSPEATREVPQIMAECGVRLVIVEKLPQAHIDGVCCWLDKQSPVIGLSIRRDKIDNFWFVLRHEIEHVLLGHGQDEAMMDDLDGERAGTGVDIPQEERVANLAASHFCAPAEPFESFLNWKRPYYYERDVVALSQVLKRHPGLVVGQMQFRLNNYSYLTRHLSKIRQFVLETANYDGWGHVFPVSN